MRRLSEFDLQSGGEPATTAGAAPLSSGRKGFSGVIVAVQKPQAAGRRSEAEIERRLIQMGFVEDAPVEMVSTKASSAATRSPSSSPTARWRLRRREAQTLLVRPKGSCDAQPPNSHERSGTRLDVGLGRRSARA